MSRAADAGLLERLPGLLADLVPRLHDRYVAYAVLRSVLATWAVLLAFDLVIAFADESGDIGDGGYTMSHALLSVLYTVPRRLYMLFPSAAVIGSVLGLGGLAAGSELIALRAAGLSKLRISLGAALSITIMTALMALVGETVGPAGEQRAQAVVTAAKSRDLIVDRFSGVWAREESMFLYAAQGLQRGQGEQRWVELIDVRMFEFEPDGRLASIAQVERAEHRSTGWTLFGIARTRFGERSATLETVARETWDSGLDAQTLASSMLRPRYLTAAQITDTIAYLERNGVDPAPFERAYWERWYYPLNVLALCLAAMPFAFGTLRSGGFGKRLFAGIVFGIAFFLVQRMALDFAQTMKWNLAWASAVPPLLVLGISWLVFRARKVARR
jgi:lipopolysaccharide export system permease protein